MADEVATTEAPAPEVADATPAPSADPIDAGSIPEGAEPEAPAAKGFKSSRQPAAPESAPDEPADDQGQQDKTEEKPNEWLGLPEADYSDEGIELPPDEQFDDPTMSQLASVCQEMGLSQKAFANIANKMSPFMIQRANELQVARMKEGLKQVHADPQLGGANYKQTIDTCNRFLKQYADPEVISALKDTGLSCHPAFIRMFHRFATELSGDTLHRGGSGNRAHGLEAFFNNSKMNK